MRLWLLAICVAACVQATSTAPGVPLAFGRWRPPHGQACYVDAVQPPELPAVSALVDSAIVVDKLRAFPPGEVLIALAFDSSGNAERVQVVDRRMSVSAADSVRSVIASHLRAAPSIQVWGGRLHASTGQSPSLAIGRRQLCPPALARIEPLLSRADTVAERELESLPSPDWIVRGDAPPAGPARTTIDKMLARKSLRDTARLTVDSAAVSPDLSAVGDGAVTMRVLIDTTGMIAHVQISRAAGRRIDRRRLAAELARYRFHPALEDRVRTPWWVILRIR